MGYSLRNDEFCFDSYKVKGAVEHSEGGVRVAAGYVVVKLWGDSRTDRVESSQERHRGDHVAWDLPQ